MLDTLDMFWLETSSTRLAGALLDVLFDLFFFLGLGFCRTVAVMFGRQGMQHPEVGE